MRPAGRGLEAYDLQLSKQDTVFTKFSPINMPLKTLHEFNLCFPAVSIIDVPACKVGANTALINKLKPLGHYTYGQVYNKTLRFVQTMFVYVFVYNI